MTLGHAVMTASLDRRLLQERTRVRTVSLAGQHLWGAVSAASARRACLLGKVLRSAQCVKLGMRMVEDGKVESEYIRVADMCEDA